MKIQLKQGQLCFRPEDGHDQHDLNTLDRWCECTIERDDHGAPLYAAITVQPKNNQNLSSEDLAARSSVDSGTPPMRLRVFERGEISIVPRTMKEHEFANLLSRAIECNRSANALNICGLQKQSIPFTEISVWEVDADLCVPKGNRAVLAGIDATGGRIRCVAHGRRHAAELINSIGGNTSANQIREYWEQKYNDARQPDLEVGVWLIGHDGTQRLV